MFGRIGPTELIIIGAVALLVVGPSRIPNFARSLGEGMREFRKGIRAAKEEINTAMADAEGTVAPQVGAGKE